jgi:hypothetical protein
LSCHNAEYINDYLDMNIIPDVVIMNPPFSSSPNSRSNSTSVTPHPYPICFGSFA